MILLWLLTTHALCMVMPSYITDEMQVAYAMATRADFQSLLLKEQLNSFMAWF